MKNWRTTLAGAIMAALAIYQMYKNPALASDPHMLAQVAAGAGLIAASDTKKEEPK